MTQAFAGIGPGTRLGDFLIGALIGRGGMGLVYVADQVSLGRRVALKLIAPDLASSPEFQARFERESRMAAAIDHPNIVPLYEAGTIDGVPYIATRYIDGSDLRSWIVARGRLAPADAVDVIAQVAGALDAAHARGLVHRDVKPANVLIADPEGARHCYLTDFGLTKHTTSHGGLTGTGQWVGTLDYVAPEQVAGASVDARADVYALGCVVFQALVGRVPFPRDSDIAKLYAHVHEPPPAPSAVAPGLPATLDAVVARALAKDPDDRFPSAGDLARAARAAVDGAPVHEPERSVAAGGAAPSAVGTRVDEPVTPLPAPPPEPPAGWTPAGWTPVPQPAPSGRAGMAIAIVVAAVLLAAGGVAAALILTGGDSGSGPSRSAAGQRTAADSAAAATTTTAAQASAAPPAGTDLAPYSTATYTAQVPATWAVDEDYARQSDGRHVSQWRSPDGSTVLIDTSTGVPPADPRASAVKLEAGAAAQSGYRRLAFRRFTSGADPAFEWRFRNGPTGTYRVDLFVYRGGDGFAVLGVAPTVRRLRGVRAVALAVTDSIAPR